ncbi:MAG: hypothetical protein ACR2ND_07445 [Solirubrobacteraceae bacterium]
MPRHPRPVILVVLVLAGSSLPVSGALAAIAPGCANPVNSALNQYCDTIPGPTGATAPKAGSPSLATALPRRVLTRIEGAGTPAGGRSGVVTHTRSGIPRQTRHSRKRAQARRRALLSLPAPGPRTPLSNSLAFTEGSLIPLWLMLVLVGLAVALTATTVAIRYRSRGDH